MKAYAKINYSLKVLGKRPDGYHELDMLMVNINLFDLLNFKKIDNGITVECSKNVCKMEDNIVYKVAKLIIEKYNINSGVKIKIKKRIPDGGGLGGGSSDAAATIKALNLMFSLNMNIHDMIEVALAVGSDVPFFLYNCYSRVKGRGEIVEPLSFQNTNNKLLLVLPKVKCSTKEVYSNVSGYSNFSIDKCIKDGNIFNDLEQASIKAYPQYNLEKIKRTLISNGAKKALMSGSGSTVFGLFDNYKKFSSIKKELSDCKLIKCKTISCCKKSLNEYN